MPQVSCNNLSFYYEEAGEGTPLVFLNGLAGNHLFWSGQVRTFSRRFRCLSLDNRDSGQSSYATEPYVMADLAADVAGLLGKLDLPPAHLVGLSLGGMIAQEVALRYPQQVRSLVLVDTLVRADEWFTGTLTAYGHIRRQVTDTPEFFQVLLPWLVSWRFFESAGKVEWLQGFLRHSPHPQQRDGFFRQLAAIGQHDTLDRLDQISCPVLVAVGEDDMICPPRYSQQIAERIPQARLEVLAGVGHSPPLEAPRRFNQLLDGFLR
jgi:pimeloyl-ACP methyl ester carboxylesterase